MLKITHGRSKIEITLDDGPVKATLRVKVKGDISEVDIDAVKAKFLELVNSIRAKRKERRGWLRRGR